MIKTITNQWLKPLSILISGIILSACNPTESSVAESTPVNKNESKPNIVWLITEDNSKHYLKLYNENGAKMPTIEKMAKNGLIFDNAFSNTPVCSTARTTLATGLYGTGIGTMNHRSYHKVSLPKGVQPFSQMLKQSGYYTTNNVKTDYNFSPIPEIWSDSSKKAHWRNRQDGQPFFHMQTFAITHEGKLHFKKGAIQNSPTKHDPSKVNLAPIYPDTPTFRYTHARTLDNHRSADNQMAQLVKQLEEDGELERDLKLWVRKQIGPLATPDLIHFTPGLPKTRSGKIMRRILRKIAANEHGQLGDTTTLADPSVVDSLVENRKNI